MKSLSQRIKFDILLARKRVTLDTLGLAYCTAMVHFIALGSQGREDIQLVDAHVTGSIWCSAKTAGSFMEHRIKVFQSLKQSKVERADRRAVPAVGRPQNDWV